MLLFMEISTDIIFIMWGNCQVFPHPSPNLHIAFSPSPLPLPLTEYLELDHQLDQLDAALTVLEGKREQLHRDAKQLLADAKAARQQNSEEEKKSSMDSDQTHSSAEKQ